MRCAMSAVTIGDIRRTAASEPANTDRLFRQGALSLVESVETANVHGQQELCLTDRRSRSPELDSAVSTSQHRDCVMCRPSRSSSSIEVNAPFRRNHATTASPRVEPWHIHCSLARDAGPRRRHRSLHDDLPALDSATFRRIVQCVKPYRLRALGVGVCMVAAAVLSLVSPWLVKRVVDVALPNGDLASSLVVLRRNDRRSGCSPNSFAWGRSMRAEMIGQEVMLDLRTALYRRFHEMPFASFTKLRSGEAVSHVLNDVQGVGDAVSGTLADVAQNTIGAGRDARWRSSVLDWRLALVAVAMMPLLITAHAAGRAGAQGDQAPRAGAHERAHRRASPRPCRFPGRCCVRTFDSGETEVARFRQHAEELKRLALAQALVGRWFRMLLRAFESVGPAIVFALGGWLIVRGQIPLGTVVALATLDEARLQPGERSRRRARGSDDELCVFRARVRRPRPDGAAAGSAAPAHVAAESAGTDRVQKRQLCVRR